MATAKATARTRRGSSRAGSPPLYPDPEKRWRPRSRKGRSCGYTFDGKTCSKRGAHYCEPRADKVVRFHAELLVHTKGPFARRALILEAWQEIDIYRPLFGEVIWSDDWGCYVRRYTQAIIVLARKNGKSAIASGMALYLMCGDDEESAEVYGAAKDTKQARKVWEPAKRMRDLSPVLSKALGVNINEKRIFHEASGSFYEMITADALGELGHNPHGFVLDEALSQADGSLWESLVTGAGARLQPLFVLITTETNRPESWGSTMIDQAEKIQEDPARAPHVFVYVRRAPRTEDQLERLRRMFPRHPDLPRSLDVWDEANWRWPNPALGTFLSIESLRRDAVDARNDPTKENGFRQFRCNQRVSQVTRWMPMHLWETGPNVQLVDEDDLAGRVCFAGLDLASTTDLACWALLFPPEEPDGPVRWLWRYWCPEAQLPALDRYTGGKATQWVRQGFLIATEGDWIDYDGDEDGLSNGKPSIHLQIRRDKESYRIRTAGYDPKEATATAQHMQRIGLDVHPVAQGYALSEALKELMRLTKAGRNQHGGHPVTNWCADNAETKTDDLERIKLIKPVRSASSARVDGIAAGATAIRTWLDHLNAGVAVGAAPALAPTGTDDIFRPSGRLDL